AAAVRALQGKPPIILVNGVLELLYVQNTGAAFSLLENAQWLFILIAVAAVLLISVFLIRLPKTKRYQPLHILLTFISAGAVGNLIDRIQLGYVRDFIYFSIIDFPVFNVADIYVTVSTALLVILVLFYYREEDFHDFRLFHRK
ncbi:MAG: signal peptidase II, partial [Bacillota bacterium]|nr:signal peptidase II [Bacillota bacterium]